MASVPTIFALIASGVEQELAAKSAEKELVKLFLDEFVAIHFVNFVLALAEGALSTKSSGCIEGTLAYILLN